MNSNSIIICKWPKPLRYKYYKNLLPGFLVTNCEKCFRVNLIIYSLNNNINNENEIFFRLFIQMNMKLKF